MVALKKKKIVLVQPKVGSWEAMQTAPLLPLALLSIAAGLQQDYDIRIIDQRLDPDWGARIRRELAGEVVAVGITAMTGPQIGYALAISRTAKAAGNVPVIWGGIHPSILPAQTVSHPLVDIVVAGEGDITFRDLVHALDRGTDYAGLPGVWTMADGTPRGSMSEVIQDINDLPPPPYQLVNIADYIGRDCEGRKKFPIKTSRGCPHRCTFCHQTISQRKQWRAQSPERVLAEMAMLRDRHDIRHFHILDDNFFADQQRVRRILSLIVAEQWTDTVFTINGTRVDDILNLDEATLALLIKAGCYELQIGLESGAQRVLDEMQKGITVAQITAANARLKQHGLRRYYELISGFPNETVAEMAATARLILELTEDDPRVFFSPLECVTPYPGTVVHDQAVAAGMQFPETLAGWSRHGFDRARLPWLDRQRRKLLEAMHLFPILISSEIKTLCSPLARAAFRLYRPLARLRVRYLFFACPLEVTLFDLLAWTRQSDRRDFAG